MNGPDDGILRYIRICLYMILIIMMIIMVVMKKIIIILMVPMMMIIILIIINYFCGANILRESEHIGGKSVD